MAMRQQLGHNLGSTSEKAPGPACSGRTTTLKARDSLWVRLEFLGWSSLKLWWSSWGSKCGDRGDAARRASATHLSSGVSPRDMTWFMW
jgi:hypothetical protein